MTKWLSESASSRVAYVVILDIGTIMYGVNIVFAGERKMRRRDRKLIAIFNIFNPTCYHPHHPHHPHHSNQSRLI
jgi:hypothetical protein